MQRSLALVMALAFSFMSSQAWSQSTSRRGQIELYAGAAFPMAPETFKDYYKVGISGHGQYVMFPSPKLGVSFTAGYESFKVDDAAIENDFAQEFQMLYGISPSAAGVTFNAEGSASVIELGIGLRPYLTAPQAHTQFFLFGMGTYNIIKDQAKATISAPPPIGTISSSATNKPRKFGVAAGAGLELPAGESFNIVLQGAFRFIFTDNESSNFLSVTGGVVF